MDEIYDLLIIGSGPAGLAAAIYAQRARLHAAVIEKLPASGGQVLNTVDVDNYPGLPGVGGYELGMKFKEHADHLGAVFLDDTIKEIRDQKDRKILLGEKDRYVAKAVIIATGAMHRELGVPGEGELKGRGVSYCATCDGAFFRNKTVAVIGGGDVALEDGIFLSRMCKKVYLIHRRDRLRGAKSLQETFLSRDNAQVLWDTVVEEIQGAGRVENIKLKNVKTGQASDLPVQGVFIAVGIVPQSDAFTGLVEMEGGYIRAGEDCVTSVPGIFAAGDVRTTHLRQVLTAAADGANAVASAERYLESIR
ncbi:MAG: thioredoxin-disulfide reductase [Lachnospiraceae bacterium]|nr:thioredoxin-disulfide reductase [Lachnospiraceae bacterium]